MELSQIIFFIALGGTAGLLGSVLGIGGGVFMVPALVLYTGVPIHKAIAASLIAMIASSSAVASVNVERGLANMRLGIFAEVFSAAGAICGALIAGYLNAGIVKFFFSLLAAFSAVSIFRKGVHRLKNPLTREPELAPEPQEDASAMDGKFYDPALSRTVHYSVKHKGPLAGLSLLAGGLSGMLGVGGGIIVVPGMNMLCKVPIKAAAATSNFMIGVTAAAGAMVYYNAGTVDETITGIMVLGVLAGSFLGMKILAKVKSEYLQVFFSFILAIVAWKMFRASIWG